MNRDFLDMLGALLGASARFLVVGAHALAVHGIPRATGDLDIWVESTPSNVGRVWRALEAFGAPLADLGVTVEHLLEPDQIVQIGVVPRRIDLLTSITGVAFGEAWSDRVVEEIDGMAVPFLGRDSLVRNKRATGRLQDLADLESLDAAG